MRGAIRYVLLRQPEDDEIDLSLEFIYTPYRAATRQDPEEPAECELLHAYLRAPGTKTGWVDFLEQMSEREIENAELFILENWED